MIAEHGNMQPQDAPPIAATVPELDRLGVPVTRLVSDSRQVRRGDTFVAYPGERADGRRFIEAAIAAGANAVLWEAEGFQWRDQWAIPNLAVGGLRYRIGEIAAHVYGDPSEKLWMIGVTGTNGKTSCAHWLARCLTAVGRKTAIVGTLGNGFPDCLAPALNTTPDAIALQAALKDYLEAGARGVAMEVSSHGLAQGRVNGIRFDVALLTNLSRDHLDYHGDMASYAAAKAGLFAWPGLRHAVLNLDDPFGRELAGKLGCTGVNLVGYSLEGGREGGGLSIRARRVEADERGVRFEAASPWGTVRVESPLLGRFNASNLLGVLATLLVSGVGLEDAARELGRLGPVKGRLERLGGDGKPLVVVDYAHTPDALEKVLLALREIMAVETGSLKLTCVFGCGGDRDRGKRALMGEVASRLADEVVVTSDNPRGEDPRAIIADIVTGMGANYHVIEDRAAAIDYAIKGARPGDVVLVAGKGHEDYQEIAGVRFPFNDAEVARRALEEWEQC
jgi:UDP-N-acetylmuramoyl-L-alanyl-D-glutamate--2,6-diaminopimelate ligase